MTKNGGPAFPTDEYYDEKRYAVTEGMTLRDYFAAQAITIAGQEMARRVGEGEIAGYGWSAVAREAFQIADAMLKAREEPTS
jgi:hypothetical protein